MNSKASVIIESLCYFLGGAFALGVAVQYGIPQLQALFGIRPLIGWWLASGIIMLALFVGAFIAARHRTKARSVRQILTALNVHSMHVRDVWWVLGGLLGVVTLTGIVVAAFNAVLGINLLSQDSYSPFLRMEKLHESEYWLFLAWIPYFFFNIVGEELFWRGYLLRRQVLALGPYAWILNGFLWSVFHVGIGWRMAVLLLPIEFLVPYVVQKRKNTWLGILIHGLYNGSGFVMVALGVVS